MSTFIKALLVAVCGILWRLGGKSGYSKAFRRVGCAICIGLALLISKNFLGLISIPLLIGAFSVGYGEDSFLMRVTKNKYITRYICGLLYVLASLPIFIHNLTPWIFHLIITPVAVMLAGNQVFRYEDEREEVFTGLVVCLIPVLGA